MRVTTVNEPKFQFELVSTSTSNPHAGSPKMGETKGLVLPRGCLWVWPVYGPPWYKPNQRAKHPRPTAPTWSIASAGFRAATFPP